MTVHYVSGKKMIEPASEVSTDNRNSQQWWIQDGGGRAPYAHTPIVLNPILFTVFYALGKAKLLIQSITFLFVTINLLL